jgi:prepilin-type N-terminal cleavage/methylation domain-containing protein
VEKESKGLTLIELMMVIACLGILAAIAVPHWISKGWPAYRLKNAACRVVADIRLARARAVATNRQFRLRFDPVFDRYLLEKGDASSGSVSWAAEGTFRRFGQDCDPGFAGVKISGEEEYSAVFRPSGGVSPGAVILRHKMGQTMKIVYSMTGRVRLIKG